ncbi:MAG: ribbon-helix-helix protein, CopG family [Clostridia bacterium]
MEKKLDRINVSLNEKENEILEDLCSENHLSKSEIIRKAIDAANANRDVLKRYINERGSSFGKLFEPKAESFNSYRFIYNLIDHNKAELNTGIMVNMGRCRISIEKGTSAVIKSIKDSIFLAVSLCVYRMKKASYMDLLIDIESIKDVRICNLNTGTSIEYSYDSACEMAGYEYIEIIC